MKDPRGILWALLISVLIFRPHLSGATYPFAQELLLIPLLLGIGIFLLVPASSDLRRSDLIQLSWPWLLIFWSIASLLWTPDPGQGVRDSFALLLNVSAFTAVYLLVKNSGKISGKNSEPIAKGFGWLSGLVTVPVLALALYQGVFGMGEIRSVLAGMSAAGEDVSGLMGTISQGRVFAGFLNSNMLAGFLAILIPVTLDLALTASRRLSVILYVTLSLAQGTVLLLTGSMGGTLVAVLAGGSVILARLRLRRRDLVGLGLTVTVLAAGLLAIRGVGSVIGPESSFTQRLGYMGAGIQMALAHPALGWGSGASPGALMGFVSDGVRPVADPHNFLVRTWIELGIPGLFIIGGFLCLLGKKVIETVRSSGLKMTVDGYVGFMFASFAFLLHSLMDMDFFVPETALFGWCAMAGLLALSTSREKKPADAEMTLSMRQTMGGIVLFAVLPTLVLLQGESVAFRALKNYQSGNYPEAAELYRESGKLMPFNGRVTLEEGRARFTAGEKVEALRLFEKADRLMAHSPYPQWDLGRAAQAEARWGESLPYLETAHDRFPTSPRILIDLARSHLNMGDQTAAAYLEEAITVAAFDPQAMELARKLLDRMPNRIPR
jgi:O-antigen ligase